MVRPERILSEAEQIELEEQVISKAYWRMIRRRIGRSPGDTLSAIIFLFVIIVLVLCFPLQARDLFLGIFMLVTIVAALVISGSAAYKLLKSWGEGANE